MSDIELPDPVAWRWKERDRFFDWTSDWTHHDRAKAMGCEIEYAYAIADREKRAQPVEYQVLGFVSRYGTEIHDTLEAATPGQPVYIRVATEASKPLLPEAPTLEESCESLYEAGHEFFKARRRDGLQGAVCWVEYDDGTMVIFTRGEYKGTLIKNIDEISEPKSHVFTDPGAPDADKARAITFATQQEAQPQAERETVDKKINKRHALNLIQELIEAERDDAYDEGRRAAQAEPAGGDKDDAERYRWLRERDCWTTAYGGVKWCCEVRAVIDKRDLPFINANYGKHLDAAVDAARAAQQATERQT